MGSVKTWSTKEEVLKDLAKASGRRIGNLDDGYLVVGDGPPPIIVEDDGNVYFTFYNTFEISSALDFSRAARILYTRFLLCH